MTPLLLRAIENTRERWRRVARGGGGRVLEEGGGLLLVAAPDTSWVCGAHITRIPDDPAAAIDRIVAFFDRHQIARWDVVAAGEIGEAVAPALVAAGFVPGERRPGMLMHPIAGSPPPVPGLEVRVVRDTHGLAVFHATSAAGFGGAAEEWARVYTAGVLDAPDQILYVGWLDGEPVATAVLGADHRIAGIGGVSTVPAARRRGIGAAMTWRAASDGFASGCLASFLEATEMGYGVYERMGYRHVIDVHTWHLPT